MSEKDSRRFLPAFVVIVIFGVALAPLLYAVLGVVNQATAEFALLYWLLTPVIYFILYSGLVRGIRNQGIWRIAGLLWPLALLCQVALLVMFSHCCWLNEVERLFTTSAFIVAAIVLVAPVVSVCPPCASERWLADALQSRFALLFQFLLWQVVILLCVLVIAICYRYYLHVTPSPVSPLCALEEHKGDPRCADWQPRKQPFM